MKLLIADDEADIRANLKNIISDLLQNAEISEAEDGSDVLELCKTNDFDIIVTDIRMTNVSGLDVIGKISNKGKLYTVFIIISGYSEFEYAQRAIEYKVVKYLLKPINKMDMEQALNLALERIKSFEEKDNLINESQNQKEALFTQALHEALTSKGNCNLKAKDVFIKYKKFGLPFVTGYNQIALINIQPEGESKSFESNEIVGNIKNQALIIFKKYSLECISIGDQQTRILFILNSTDKIMKSTILSLFKDLMYSIGSFYLKQIVVGISDVMVGTESLQILYEQSNTALGYKVLYPNKSIIFYEELKEKKNDYKLPIEAFTNLVEAVNTNNKKLISEIIDSLFDYESIRFYTIDIVRRLYESLLNYIFINIINPNPYLRLQSKVIELFAADFNNYCSLSEIILNIKKTIFVICDQIVSNPINEVDKQVVQKALNYINRNYNKDISMSTVANHVCISYNHFSKLFKDATGENFIDYITKLKIEKARNLLADPGLSVKEIADLLGYNNPGHFSKVFCEYTGLMPREYRNKVTSSVE